MRIVLSFLLVFFIFLIPANLHSQNKKKPGQRIVTLNDNQGQYNLGLYLDTLEDQNGNLSILDVFSTKHAKDFIANKSKKPSFGFTDSVIWVRFTLKNTSRQTKEWYLEHGFANTHHIDLYLPYDNANETQSKKNIFLSDKNQGQNPKTDKSEKVLNPFQVKRTGILHKFNNRDIAYHNVVFKIPIEYNSQKTFYLRIQSEASKPLPLTIWQPEAFAMESRLEILFQGLFIGMLLIMAAYNLFIWFFLKESSYLYYVLFIISYVLYHLSIQGLAAEYLWPNTPWFNQIALPLFIICCIIMALKFSTSFLKTKTKMPKLHKIITIVLICLFGILVQLIFIRYIYIIFQTSFFIAIISILLPTTAISTWRGGYKPARYYLFGMLILCFMAIAWLLALFDIIPDFIVIQRGMPFGVVIMMLFLSLALADRINLLKEENEKAQEIALRATQKHRDLVEQKNTILEKQVAQRTIELSLAKEKAEESDRLKSSFLENMSHEIRTPMNAVIGFTDLMLNDDLTIKHREYLNTVKKSGNLLLTLINDILDISKIEAGQLKVVKEPFSLKETLQIIESNIVILLKKTDSVTLKISANNKISDLILGDSVRLQQVLINLLGNSIKFTKSGSIEFGVNLINNPNPKKEIQEYLEFHVKDTGRGIPLKKQKLIFEAFGQVQGEDSWRKGGTGLGLAISKKLVELMGGMIRVVSKGIENQGSTFYFTIPFQPAHGFDKILDIQPSSIPKKIKNGCILLVEDNLANQILATHILKKMGYKVEVANNGEEAYATYKSNSSIALILMDLFLPDIHGLKVTAMIRELEANKKIKNPIPIIALTAEAMSGEKERCLQAGCNDYLTKPIDQKQLQSTIEGYIG